MTYKLDSIRFEIFGMVLSQRITYSSMLLGLLVASLLGCGQKAIDPNKNSKSQSSIDQANTIYMSKNYGAAMVDYEAAISAGGLDAEALGEAYVRLARCYGETGDSAKAESTLALAEQSPASSTAEFYVAKGVIARKGGKEDLAEQAFSKAQEIDPDVVLP